MAWEPPPLVIPLPPPPPPPLQPPVGGFPTLPSQPPYVAQPSPNFNVVDNFGDISITSWHPQYAMSVIGVYIGVIGTLTASVNQQIASIPTTMDEHIRKLSIDDGDSAGTHDSLKRDADIVKALIEGLRKELARQTSLVRPEFRVSDLADRSNAVHAFNRISGDRAYTSGTPNQAYKIWSSSYRAQYMEVLIRQQIAYLEGKLRGIESDIAAAESDPSFQQNLVAKNTFTAPVAMASAVPFVAVSEGVAAIASAAEIALKEAIATAAARLAAAGAAVASATVAVFAILMAYSPRLGDSTRPTLSTPLADIYPEGGDLQELALQGGELEMPLRLAFKGYGVHEQVYMAQTGGAIPRNVRVRAVRFDAGTGRYSFQTDDTPPRTLVWTPSVDPGDSSTELPPMDTDLPDYTGPVLTPVDPTIEVFPAVEDAPFDDYVLVFPADSGIEPIYVMFRDRREDPGVAKGMGETVTGALLPQANSGNGAAIPSQIADRLRGREFARFDRLREAVWIEIGLDQTLSSQFNAQQKALLAKGRAPYPPQSEQVGGRMKYELHHVEQIGLGGEVYDLDNIRIVTPKRHIEIHTNKGGD